MEEVGFVRCAYVVVVAPEAMRDNVLGGYVHNEGLCLGIPGLIALKIPRFVFERFLNYFVALYIHYSDLLRHPQPCARNKLDHSRAEAIRGNQINRIWPPTGLRALGSWQCRAMDQ